MKNKIHKLTVIIISIIVIFLIAPSSSYAFCKKGSIHYTSPIYTFTVSNGNTCSYYIKYCDEHYLSWDPIITIDEVVFLDKNCLLYGNVADPSLWEDVYQHVLDDLANNNPNFIPICNPNDPSTRTIVELHKSECWFYYSDSQSQTCNLKPCEDGDCERTYKICWESTIGSYLNKELVSVYSIPGTCGPAEPFYFDPINVGDVSSCFNTCN